MVVPRTMITEEVAAAPDPALQARLDSVPLSLSPRLEKDSYVKAFGPRDHILFRAFFGLF